MLRHSRAHSCRTASGLGPLPPCTRTLWRVLVAHHTHCHFAHTLTVTAHTLHSITLQSAPSISLAHVPHTPKSYWEGEYAKADWATLENHEFYLLDYPLLRPWLDRFLSKPGPTLEIGCGSR